MFHLGGKSDFEKNKDALEIISKMLEILDRFEKKWKTEPEKRQYTKFRKYYLQSTKNLA